jgi:hypothetical protein
MSAINTTHIEKINLNYITELNGVTFGGCDAFDVVVIPMNVEKIDDQEFFDCNFAVVIENPNLITTNDTFMRAENVTVFLDYDVMTEKELSWIPFVKAIYVKSEWTYVDGIPTPIN